MTKKMIWALALLAIVAALLMGVGAVWLTGEVLMFPAGRHAHCTNGHRHRCLPRAANKAAASRARKAKLETDLGEAQRDPRRAA